MLINEATLIEYSLDTLMPDERRAVDAALEQSVDLRAQLSQLVESLGDLGELASMSPPPNLRSTVVNSPDGDLAGFCQRLAQLFKIELNLAQQYLAEALLAPGGRFQKTSMPGVYSLSVPEANIKGDAKFIFLEPGHMVPPHGHSGDETMLVLDGYATESTGRGLCPGDLVFSDVHKEHDFQLDTDGSCLFAVVLDGQMQLIPDTDSG